MNKSEITLNVGEEAELTYTNSSGYNLPFAEWSTSNESVAKLFDSSSFFSKNKVIGYKSVTIDAIGEGQCIIYCDGKNGSNAVTCKVTVIDNRWVKADVPSGGVKKGTKVTLSCTKPGATIYYTTDESEPSKYSNIYTSPIEINKSMTLKAKAYLGSQESATSQWKYTVSNHLDGDIFEAKTIEGVEVSYKAYVTAQQVYCLVSSGISNIAAIDRKYTGHLTIPEYADGIPVRGIDERAFYNCKVTSISLPTYTGMFYSTSFSIGKYAFEYSNLTSLTIPKKIHADIKEGAFRLCTALETVTFEHYTLENIGIYAFEGCTGIKTIYSYVTDPPKLLDKRFEDKTLSNAILYVPKDNYDNYRYSTWNKFKNIVAMGSEPTPSSEPTNISVYPTSKTIKVGESFSMSYTLTPSDVQTTISWSSDNSNIATVSSTGVVKGIKAGTTYIYAKTSNGKSDYCMVTVEEKITEPTNISVYPTSKTIKVGESFSMSYTLTPSDAQTTISWSSDNSNIATVSSTGVVKGIKAGSTYIYAKTSNGKSDYCMVTVESDSPAPSSSIEINATNFPDANFRNYLLEQDYGIDGIITSEEIKTTTFLRLSSKNIKTLKGIEYFTALTYLYCDKNQLTTLDVSKNTALYYLNCNYNQLTSLDVSKNTKLHEFWCNSNQLTSLDVSKNAALSSLHCSSNQLNSLYVSKNTELSNLQCESNQLSYLDVSKNAALSDLNCSSNQLSSLDVSKNEALTWLQCVNNQLSYLDISKNRELTDLYCGYNQLTSLDLSNNIKLNWLNCNSNQLNSLNISKNEALTWLQCSSNQLSSLDVSRNKELEDIDCSDNCIKEAAMDNLINSLTNNTTGNERKIYVFDYGNSEGNVCTKDQVAAIKAKGWTPYDVYGYEYAGSDPSGIIGIELDEENTKRIYDLSGKPLPKPRKGINIIDGKKVIVR